MKKLFVGLLVGICVIMFSSPLMAADTPESTNLSSLQAIDDAQLSQIRGQGWKVTSLVFYLQTTRFFNQSRRSKFSNTLSNMMKKISTTQDILVQNIK
jgi:hypothetical protein